MSIVELPESCAPRRWDCHVHVFGGRGCALVSSADYSPPERSIGHWAQAAASAEINCSVLVQPSVYGTDNGCLLDALQASGGHHRGVAVVDTLASDALLEHFHASGIRGVRFNAATPGTNGLRDFEALAGRLAALAWHAEFLVEPEELAVLRAFRASTDLPFVLEHFGGLAPGQLYTGAWSGLAALMDDGRCWLKLSAFYRRSRQPNYEDFDALIAAAAERWPQRLLWGSDWPHSHFFRRGRAAPPRYADTLAPLTRALANNDIVRTIVERNPLELYGRDQ